MEWPSHDNEQYKTTTFLFFMVRTEINKTSILVSWDKIVKQNCKYQILEIAYLWACSIYMWWLWQLGKICHLWIVVTFNIVVVCWSGSSSSSAPGNLILMHSNALRRWQNPWYHCYVPIDILYQLVVGTYHIKHVQESARSEVRIFADDTVL